VGFCHFIDAVVDLYTDASTHFTLAKDETPKIPMTRGVKQGDPLSPLLFNVAMDRLLEAISAQNNGFKWDESGLQLEAICYADDNGLTTFLWHASPVIYHNAKVFSSVSWCYQR
jgi:hypothetical protein